jgi:hypothetical protein
VVASNQAALGQFVVVAATQKCRGIRGRDISWLTSAIAEE